MASGMVALSQSCQRRRKVLRVAREKAAVAPLRGLRAERATLKVTGLRPITAADVESSGPGLVRAKEWAPVRP